MDTVRLLGTLRAATITPIADEWRYETVGFYRSCNREPRGCARPLDAGEKKETHPMGTISRVSGRAPASTAGSSSK